MLGKLHDRTTSRSVGHKLSIATFALLILSVACSGSNVTSPENRERRTEAQWRFSPGLEETVRIDTVRWDLGLYDFTIPERVQIYGNYNVIFRNLGQQQVDLRYELQFYDEETFLIDIFRPFGQPMQLPPRQARTDSGSFFLRIPDPKNLRFISTMRVVASVATP